MALFFNLLILAELLTIPVLLWFARGTLFRHWRTTLGGLFVFAVCVFGDGLYFYRTGHIHDALELSKFLGIAIMLLLAEDAHAKK